VKDQYPSVYASLLMERAGLHLDEFELPAADQLASQALELFVRSGDRSGEAQAENLLGLADLETGRYIDARGHLARALEVFEALKDETHIAVVHHNLGILERRDDAGDKEKAAWHFQGALRTRRALNERRGVAETLNCIGVLAQLQGDPDTAWDCYAESLRLQGEVRNSFLAACAFNNLGEIAEIRGEWKPACSLFAAAEKLFEEIKSPFAAKVWETLSRVAGNLPNPETAILKSREEVHGKPLDELIAQVGSGHTVQEETTTP